MPFMSNLLVRRLLGLLFIFVLALLLPGCQPAPPGNSGNDNVDNTNDNGIGSPGDADGDGVRDTADDCPNTADGANVDENGCALSQLDSDGDRVNDDADACPGTTPGTQVGANGCPLVVGGDDEDNDGVADGDDDCPGTPPNSPIDENGCAAAQRDSDGDEVSDDLDRCPNTATNAVVDADGCSEGQVPLADADGDNVPDGDDDCDNTPDGAVVDENGCGPTQRDSDGDGVVDADDDCPGTPTGQSPNDGGCALSQLDIDGDGVFDDLDQCPNSRPGEQVNLDTGCPVDAPPPPPPPPGGLPNDLCSSPTTVSDGTTAFSTTGSTGDTTGVTTGTCTLSSPEEDYYANDIWYCYTASCAEFVTVSLCGSEYDTTLSVYTGCGCPTAGAVVCSDDDCGFGLDSRVTFPAARQGQQYLIRIGGFVDPGTQVGETGNGLLAISCGGQNVNIDEACVASSGDCFAPHDGPGCNTDCCQTVCTEDPFCCDAEWDDFCVQEANGFCGTGFQTCGSRAGACNAVSSGPGCNDVACCNEVCQVDAFCCLIGWDQNCVAASAVCVPTP